MEIETSLDTHFSVRDTSGMSAGQRFMTDLLVSSLMADGGLEFAMEAAIKKETQAFEDKKVKSFKGQNTCNGQSRCAVKNYKLLWFRSAIISNKLLQFKNTSMLHSKATPYNMDSPWLRKVIGLSY